MESSKEDLKCAPHLKYVNGSCLELNDLIIIATAHNNINKDDEIKIKQCKKYLVKELDRKLSNICSNQICWIESLIKLTKDKRNNELKQKLETILDESFRPSGPSKGIDWLSTTDINEVIYQYHKVYPEFLFLGAVPYDFEELPVIGISDINFKTLEKEGKYKIGLVINLDEHYKSGSHWVALYVDLKQYQVYFFDSFAKVPRNRIKKFITKIVNYLYYKKYNKKINFFKVMHYINELKNENKELYNKYINKLQEMLKKIDIRYNTIQHQFKDSECGVYSTNFILRLVKGESFDSITQNITKDDEINECRDVYFR